MRRLKLSIEDLLVESFSTANRGVNRGTVRAHGDETLSEDTFDPQYTCQSTCPPKFTCVFPPCRPATADGCAF